MHCTVSVQLNPWARAHNHQLWRSFWFLQFLWLGYFVSWDIKFAFVLACWIIHGIFFCSIQEIKPNNGVRWIGKINFVEIRSFWHIFRSFDRMWSFYILCLQVPLHALSSFLICSRNLVFCFSISSFVSQAMIIIAWNGGSPGDAFDDGVFKEVLSIFITAAILKLGQGKMKRIWCLYYCYASL